MRYVVNSVLLLAVFFASNSILASDFNAIEWDGVPWVEQTNPSRIVAIGDIHGDLDSLLQILENRGLIDFQGQWIGKDAHLVIQGDLSDRGPDPRFVMDFLMKLEGEALASGGKVHVLLGNHDLYVQRGFFRDTNPLEIYSYQNFKDFGDPSPYEPYQKITSESAREARDRMYRLGVSQEQLLHFSKSISGNSKYAKWIRSRNSIIKIGDTIFTHGGLDYWAFYEYPSRINSTIRSWISYFQGMTTRPAENTVGWVQKGPLESRAMAHEDLEKEDIAHILDHYSAKRIVLGHTFVPSFKIREIYDGKVYLIDTGISSVLGGKLSALEINNGQVTVVNSIAPPARMHPITKKYWKELLPPHIKPTLMTPKVVLMLKKRAICERILLAE